MSSINSISSSLIQSYVNYQAKKELTPQNMFQMLSIELGGDGETITKTQLDTYIKSAKDGTIKVSNAELGALKTLQDKWDTISGGKDSITFGDMANYTTLLVSIVTSGIVGADDSDSATSSMSSTDKIKAYLIDSALKGSAGDNSVSGATSLLQTLLKGTTDTKDDSNSEIIAALVNFIADSKSSSTVSVKA